MSKYYSLYIADRDKADKFSAHLKTNNHYYERSGCGDGFYFCVRLNPDQVSRVNEFLDTLL